MTIIMIICVLIMSYVKGAHLQEADESSAKGLLLMLKRLSDNHHQLCDMEEWIHRYMGDRLQPKVEGLPDDYQTFRSSLCEEILNFRDDLRKLSAEGEEVWKQFSKACNESVKFHPDNKAKEVESYELDDGCDTMRSDFRLLRKKCDDHIAWEGFQTLFLDELEDLGSRDTTVQSFLTNVSKELSSYRSHRKKAEELMQKFNDEFEKRLQEAPICVSDLYGAFRGFLYMDEAVSVTVCKLRKCVLPLTENCPQDEEIAKRLGEGKQVNEYKCFWKDLQSHTNKFMDFFPYIESKRYNLRRPLRMIVKNYYGEQTCNIDDFVEKIDRPVVRETEFDSIWRQFEGILQEYIQFHRKLTEWGDDLQKFKEGTFSVAFDTDAICLITDIMTEFEPYYVCCKETHGVMRLHAALDRSFPESKYFASIEKQVADERRLAAKRKYDEAQKLVSEKIECVIL
ncbi:MAG: hypothetical protein OXC30_01170 [Alphaproteobacteria bacterium]|nr:hypothetical protein [Alphaproteobacteria bacterium]